MAIPRLCIHIVLANGAILGPTEIALLESIEANGSIQNCASSTAWSGKMCRHEGAGGQTPIFQTDFGLLHGRHALKSFVVRNPNVIDSASPAIEVA
jgi:hypothetical protein